MKHDKSESLNYSVVPNHTAVNEWIKKRGIKDKNELARISQGWPYGQKSALETKKIEKLLKGEYKFNRSERINFAKSLSALLELKDYRELLVSGGIDSELIQNQMDKWDLNVEQLALRSQQPDFVDASIDRKTVAKACTGQSMLFSKIVNIANILDVDPGVLIIEDTPPYKGLNSFGIEDARHFAGRDEVVREIVDAFDEKKLVNLIGASGSGKSSVMFAGVVPRLHGLGSKGWRIIHMKPGENPIYSLKEAVKSSKLENIDFENTEKEPIDVRFENWEQCTSEILRDFKRLGRASNKVLIIIDQWEEIYTRCDDNQQHKAFIDVLLAISRNKSFRILLGCRADFYDQILGENEKFLALEKAGHMPLRSMNVNEYRSAIMQPALEAGFRFEDHLVDTILLDAQITNSFVNDHGHQEETNIDNSSIVHKRINNALPLIQVTLTELWKKRDRNRNRITMNAYKGLKGISGSIDQHADEIFEQLTSEQQNLAALVFPRLIKKTRSGQLVSNPVRESFFSKNEINVLQKLAQQEAWLVTFDWDDVYKETVIAISHEALAREWSKLRSWLASTNENFLGWLDDMSQKIDLYEKNGFRREDLLSGSSLEYAKAMSGLLDAKTSANKEKNNVEAKIKVRIPSRIGTFVEDSIENLKLYIAEKEKVEKDRTASKRREIEAQRKIDKQEKDAAILEAQNSKRLARRTKLGLFATSTALAFSTAVSLFAFSQFFRAENTLGLAIQTANGVVTDIVNGISNESVPRRFVSDLLEKSASLVQSLSNNGNNDLTLLLAKYKIAESQISLFRDLGEIEKLEVSIQERLQISKEIEERFDAGGATELFASSSMIDKCVFEIETGDFENAIPICEQAKEIARVLHKNNENDLQRRFVYSESLISLARGFRRAGRDEEAIIHLKDAIALNMTSYQFDPSSIATIGSWITSLATLGKIYIKLGDLVSAKSYLKDAERLYILLLANNKSNLRVILNKLITKNDIGRVYMLEKDFKSAKEIFENILTQTAELSRKVDDHFGIKEFNAVVNYNLSESYTEEGNINNAIEHLVKTIKTREELLQLSPEDRQNRFSLGEALEKLGKLRSQTQDYKGAINAHGEQIGIWRWFEQRDSTYLDYQHRLAVALSEYAIALEAEGKNKRAIAAESEAFQLMSALASRKPAQLDWIINYSVNLRKRGRQAFLEKDYSTAYEYMRDSFQVLANPSSETKNRQLQTNLITSHRNQARELLATTAAHLTHYSIMEGKYIKAEAYSRDGIDLLPNNLVLTLNLAHALMLQDKADEAEAYYKNNIGKVIDGNTRWEEAVLSDFNKLSANGVTHKLMDDIRQAILDTNVH